ncbi:YbhB/YbcL family Raf kinase inhibitor-like protein [Edaphobacter bradus]|uniref:YbhB/YbcL family Raf kinase inhibitor-like protein n=1 Tax=Edaphobacter bradus TaxID=2259016 RepID=UPI0021E04A54|nr:YbhB/YbcL family Raf kinase inhibitor-like protein [Edaphobacter bradus]
MTSRSALHLSFQAGLCLLLTGALTATQLACNRGKIPQGLPTFELKSASFSGDTIPNQYSSCGGEANDSPVLTWQSPPARTQSLALIVTDPDAPIGNFTHWVLYDLPPDTRELPQAILKKEQLPNGSRQGVNDFGEIGYDGPCPPDPSAHRYVFDLYALDTKLNLPAGASKKQVIAAMNGHILARGQLTGRFQR